MNNFQELEKETSEVSDIVKYVILQRFRISRLLKTKKGVDYYLIIDQDKTEDFQEQDKYHCFEKGISESAWKKIKELRSRSSLEVFYKVAKGGLKVVIDVESEEEEQIIFWSDDFRKPMEYQSPDNCPGYHNKRNPRDYKLPHICNMCHNTEKGYGMEYFWKRLEEFEKKKR